SLNPLMAGCLSVLPGLLLSSITETKYYTEDHLLRFGTPLVNGLTPLLQTPLPRSDTASRMSFETFCQRLSTFRLQAFGPSVASLSATSRSKVSMIQKPAKYFSFPT